MRVACIDLATPGEEAPREPSAHFGAPPTQVPSPALLALAGARRRAGDEVLWLSGAAPEPERLVGSELVLLGGDVDAAQALAAKLKLPTEICDPWKAPAGLPDYGVAGAKLASDVDGAPSGNPVHPWAWPTTPPRGAEVELMHAAIAAAPVGSEIELCLWDERARLDMERLRRLAEVVRQALRERKILVNLHLRAWPDDLLGERVLDHLSLLPVASLDVLAGGLDDRWLAPHGRHGAAEVKRCVQEVDKAGLAHLSRLSLVLGVPGQAPEEAVEVVNQAVQLIGQHRATRLRLAYDHGRLEAPMGRAALAERFAATHPDWDPAAYRGLGDLVALLTMANRQLRIAGPLS